MARSHIQPKKQGNKLGGGGEGIGKKWENGKGLSNVKNSKNCRLRYKGWRCFWSRHSYLDLASSETEEETVFKENSADEEQLKNKSPPFLK